MNKDYAINYVEDLFQRYTGLLVDLIDKWLAAGKTDAARAFINSLQHVCDKKTEVTNYLNENL